jgi:hypothetical protein
LKEAGGRSQEEDLYTTSKTFCFKRAGFIALDNAIKTLFILKT